MINSYQFSSSFCICRRRVLQVENISGINNLDSQPINASSSSSPAAAAAASSLFSPTAKFDSTMALIVVVLLTALFFMCLCSVYIRRLANAADPETPPSTPTRPRRKGGLDPSAVGSLPLVAYGSAAKHRAVDDCPICLSEFEEGERVKLIPYCGHVFHAGCIDTWLSSHVTCPLCRSSQLFKRSGDEAAEGLFGDEHDAAAHV